jgi:predicted metal-dependent peptidase
MAKKDKKEKKKDYSDDCLRARSETRAFIKQKAPYFMTIMYGFVPRLIPGLRTMGVTNQMVLVVDPEWFVEMQRNIPDLTGNSLKERMIEMRGACLAHEGMHVLRGIDRIEAIVRAGVDKTIANIGFDIPINDDLRDAGWHLPGWAMFADTFGFEKGLTGEQYCELLEQRTEKIELLCGFSSGDAAGDSAGGSGGSGDDSDGEGSDSGSGSGSADQHSGGKGRLKGRICAGGFIENDVAEEVNKESGRSKADCQRIRKDGIREIVEASKGRGDVPGSYEEYLEDSVESRVPWRTQLAQIIRKASGRVMVGQADFSLRRPSKRSYTRGIIRPGMIERKVEVAFIEDSSGSMGREELMHARAEASAVFQQLCVSDAWFMDADTQVASPPERIGMRELATLPVRGRGGTDFRQPLDVASKLQPKPDVVIYLTDGDGEAPPGPPPGIEVVWCIVPTSWGRRPANWGHLVVVSDDQELCEPYESYNYDDDDEDDEAA